MSSSTKNSHSLEEQLYGVILGKDGQAARNVLSELLGEAQLAMPGFDTVSPDSDEQKQQRARAVLQRVARHLKTPGNTFQMAFGRSTDLYQIVDALASKNFEDRLDEIQPQVFHLVRPARALRLDDPGYAWDHYKGGKWIVQQKMDGWYAQVHLHNGNVVLLSRRGQEFTFASKLVHTISALFPRETAIFECELVTMSPAGSVGPRTNMKSQETEIRAYFFDLLYWNDDWTRKPYTQRLEKLQELLHPVQSGLIRLITWKAVTERQDFVSSFDEWTKLAGLEGMIAKRPDAIYEADCMTKNFLKIKSKDTVDAVVLGYIDSPRSYLLGLWDEDENIYVPFVWVTVPNNQRDVIAEEVKLNSQDSPPLSAGDRITEVRTVPDFVVEVAGDRLQETEKFPCGKRQTGKGWTLFAASIKGIRYDKGVSDITTVDGFLGLQTMAGQEK